MPRSRNSTFSRRYAGCERSFHSWTQYSEQKVNRPRGTSSEHQRHIPRPLGPRGIAPRSTHPPAITREVLTFLFYNEEPSLHICLAGSHTRSIWVLDERFQSASPSTKCLSKSSNKYTIPALSMRDAEHPRSKLECSCRRIARRISIAGSARRLSREVIAAKEALLFVRCFRQGFLQFVQ